MPLHPLPLNPDSKYQHQIDQATPLTQEEKIALEKKLKIIYQQAVDKIIYVIITWQPDVSYTIIKLSQYSYKLAAIHYHALKSQCVS